MKREVFFTFHVSRFTFYVSRAASNLSKGFTVYSG